MITYRPQSRRDRGGNLKEKVDVSVHRHVMYSSLGLTLPEKQSIRNVSMTFCDIIAVVDKIRPIVTLSYTSSDTHTGTAFSGRRAPS